MKTTDIAKIRQFISEIKEAFELYEWGHYPVKADILLEKILALLPCETCGGTGNTKASVIDDLSGGIVDTDIPCPDCQS